MNKTLLIGISGKMGTGKNYIAEHIVMPYLRELYKNQNVLELAFADQIKVNAMVKYGLTMQAIANKTSHVRSILQREGTEEGRDKMGDNVWIDYISKWIDLYETRGVKAFVITDVRFKNEVEFLQGRGGVVIRVEAPLRNTDRLITEQNALHIQTHRSETELDNYKAFDLVVHNDFGTDERITLKIIRDFLSSNT